MRGSLRRGIVELLCSDHAQPPHEIPDSPQYLYFMEIQMLKSARFAAALLIAMAIAHPVFAQSEAAPTTSPAISKPAAPINPSASAPAAPSTGEQKAELVDINTATAAQLKAL